MSIFAAIHALLMINVFACVVQWVEGADLLTPHVVSLPQGVAELKRELSERAVLTEMPEIHQFLDGFYLSRIGIRILIGKHCSQHPATQQPAMLWTSGPAMRLSSCTFLSKVLGKSRSCCDVTATA